MTIPGRSSEINQNHRSNGNSTMLIGGAPPCKSNQPCVLVDNLGGFDSSRFVLERTLGCGMLKLEPLPSADSIAAGVSVPMAKVCDPRPSLNPRSIIS